MRGLLAEMREGPEDGSGGVSDFLIGQYDLLRGLHIIGVIAWMAGMLYLPRLYVYHARATPGSEMDETFKVMELKLLRIIINPAMIFTLVMGLALIWVDGHIRGWSFLAQPWMLTKLAGVVFLFGWHGFLFVLPAVVVDVVPGQQSCGYGHGRYGFLELFHVVSCKLRKNPQEYQLIGIAPAAAMV